MGRVHLNRLIIEWAEERYSAPRLNYGTELAYYLTDRFQACPPSEGSGFKGYNRLSLLTILIKTWNNQHNPLGETVLNQIEDMKPLIIAD